MSRITVNRLRDEREALSMPAQRERRNIRDQVALTISHESTDCDWINLVWPQCTFCSRDGYVSLCTFRSRCHERLQIQLQISSETHV